MTEPPGTSGGAVRFRVADTVVVRVAEQSARGVPGVVALPAGVRATVRGGAADVAVTIGTRLGHNCRDLAQAVQRDVLAEVGAVTGLEVTVTITVADVLLD